MLLIGTLPATTTQAETSTATITNVTEAIYDSIGIYSEGLIWVKEGETFKYLDEQGKVVIDLSDKKYVGEKEYVEEVGDFHDGLALVNVKKEASEDDFDYDIYAGGYYIDKQGNIVLTAGQVNDKMVSKDRPISGLYSIFAEGVTITDSRPGDGKICVVTPEGNSHWYKGAIGDYYWYTQNLLCMGEYIKGKFLWGYVDKNFKKPISFKYEQARPFNQDLAPVEIKGKWGFINKDGKTVIKMQYDDFAVADKNYTYQVFNDGLACVNKEGKWGFINKSGKTVIAFKYKSPLMFKNGFTFVKGSDGKYTYINKKGKTAIKTKYEDANYFNVSGVAVVGNNGTYKLIDTKGAQIGTQTWEFDGTMVSTVNPDILKYKIGDKWGIAKIG